MSLKLSLIEIRPEWSQTLKEITSLLFEKYSINY